MGMANPIEPPNTPEPPVRWCKCGMRAAPGTDACELCTEYPWERLDLNILAAMRHRAVDGMISATMAARIAQALRDDALKGVE